MSVSKVETPNRGAAAQQSPDNAPEISIVMACYNAAAYLSDAVQSALAQTDIDLEVLIVDDHSTDASFELAKSLAHQDQRIRVFRTSVNSGPGGARNVGIENMHGRWYSMLDCDDVLAPERSRTMIDAAEAVGADMIADNLQVFGEGIEPHRHLGRDFQTRSGDITLDAYFAGTVMFSPKPNLGFLKPIIRRSAMQNTRYRSDLRIAEDDELVIRLLLAGVRYTYLPRPFYLYRKHDGSISHRLSSKHADLMVRSEQDIRNQVVAAGLALGAYQVRYDSIRDAAAFSHSVEALKARDIIGAVGAIIRRPSALRHYRMPISAAWKRLTGAP